MNQTIPNSSFRELLLFFLRQRWRVRIAGNSMLPMFKDGDEVLVSRRLARQRSPIVGEIVVCQHPTTADFLLVKRVEAVREDGACFVVGDNPSASSDSRQFGWISADNILGIVTSRF